MRNTNNLCRTDWMEQFKLWNSPISLFCQEIKGFTNEAESLKKELKIKFSEVFSGCLGRCNKMKGKCSTGFQKEKECTLYIVKTDQYLTDKKRILSKIDHSDWVSPTVYIKKKPK